MCSFGLDTAALLAFENHLALLQSHSLNSVFSCVSTGYGTLNLNEEKNCYKEIMQKE